MLRFYILISFALALSLSCNQPDSSANASHNKALISLKDKPQLVHGVDFSKYVYGNGHSINFQCLVDNNVQYFVLGYNLKLFAEADQSASATAAARNLVNVIKANPDKELTFDIYINACMNDEQRYKDEVNKFLKAYLKEDVRDYISRVWIDVEYRDKTNFGCSGPSPFSGSTLASWIEATADVISRKAEKVVGVYSNNFFFKSQLGIPVTDYMRKNMPFWEASWGTTSRTDSAASLASKFYNSKTYFPEWSRSMWQHATEQHWRGMPECGAGSIDYNLVDLNRFKAYDHVVN